jgi:hypothetical protein
MRLRARYTCWGKGRIAPPQPIQSGPDLVLRHMPEGVCAFREPVQIRHWVLGGPREPPRRGGCATNVAQHTCRDKCVHRLCRPISNSPAPGASPGEGEGATAGNAGWLTGRTMDLATGLESAEHGAKAPLDCRVCVPGDIPARRGTHALGRGTHCPAPAKKSSRHAAGVPRVPGRLMVALPGEPTWAAQTGRP